MKQPISLPLWAWALPAASALLLAFAFAGLVPGGHGLVLALAALLLGGTVFAAVHHAEVVALRVGEPFGSIVLAVAVTVIEVGLVVSIMLAAPEKSATIARDTVFSAIMIVLNGVVGLCLLIGGIRFHQQGYQVQGASSALGVLATLAILGLVLPNYTLTVPGPYFAPAQLIFVGVVSLALYGLFLFVQTVRHRDYFLDPEPSDAGHAAPGSRIFALSASLLLLGLASVILLAKMLSPAVERAVAGAALPSEVVGVVIALIVLLPESVAALRAAGANRLQTSLNLTLGSGLASIGLTIPTIAVLSLAGGPPLALGLENKHVVLLVLTLFASALTLATGRATVLQGGVHIVIFGAFLTISLVP